MARGAAVRLVAALFVVGSAAPAAAADWKVSGTFGQGFNVRTEAGDDAESGLLLGSRTSLGLSIIARTETTTWTLAPNLNFLARSSGDSQDRETTSFNGSFRGGVTHVMPRYSITGGLRVTPRFVSDREFEEVFETDPISGLVESTTRVRNVDPLEITVAGNLGASFILDPLNTVSISGFGRLRDYDQTSDRFQQNRTVGGSLAWSHRLNTLTSLSLQGSASYFSSDAEDTEDAITLSTRLGLSQRLTPRHSGSLTLGGAFTERDGETSFNFVGGANLSYAAADTRYNIGLSQGIAQNDNGEVSAVVQLRGGGSYRINETSSLALNMRAATSNPLFDGDGNADEVNLIITPSYQHRLSPSWRISAGYGLRIELDDDENRLENRVFVNLTRSLAILD